MTTVMPPTLGRLSEWPPVRLGHAPTPLEAMPNLTARLGGARLFVKRDDCTGLALGGNKVRQLEFYLGEAKARGADTVLITGAVQSNFARLAAAAARTLAMDCHVQLEARVPDTGVLDTGVLDTGVLDADAHYRESGNVLLNRILGATLHAYPNGEDEAGADRRLDALAVTLTEAGRRPYVIHLGPGHAPLGALGYVVAALETHAQLTDLGLAVDEIVVPSGSGATHAGLLFGLRALGWPGTVTGVCVRRAAAAQRERIAAHCRALADLLDMAPVVDAADIVLTDAFLAPGYGQLNEATTQAITAAARCEALICDPVYSGKAMAGLIQRAKQAGSDRTLLFLHTGGTPAVFAYGPALTGALGG